MQRLDMLKKNHVNKTKRRVKKIIGQQTKAGASAAEPAATERKRDKLRRALSRTITASGNQNSAELDADDFDDNIVGVWSHWYAATLIQRLFWVGRASWHERRQLRKKADTGNTPSRPDGSAEPDIAQLLDVAHSGLNGHAEQQPLQSVGLAGVARHLKTLDASDETQHAGWLLQRLAKCSSMETNRGSSNHHREDSSTHRHASHPLEMSCDDDRPHTAGKSTLLSDDQPRIHRSCVETAQAIHGSNAAAMHNAASQGLAMTASCDGMHTVVSKCGEDGRTASLCRGAEVFNLSDNDRRGLEGRFTWDGTDCSSAWCEEGWV